jgi:hypothetical protein
MHELRRQGFDDDEFRGKNSEEVCAGKGSKA